MPFLRTRWVALQEYQRLQAELTNWQGEAETLAKINAAHEREIARLIAESRTYRKNIQRLARLIFTYLQFARYARSGAAPRKDDLHYPSPHRWGGGDPDPRPSPSD